tara:strand:- start:379 stop:1425 length:1047 start_codon:yes stop_codon:yes gene_type:complete
MNIKKNQEHLANRMIDGAKSLYDLFEWLKDSREPLTDKQVEKITKPYELTQNQGLFLNKTVTRAKRAQGIVRYLENRFGVDEDLNFEDSEGLHKLLFKNVYCPKEIQAKSHNIGIGLTRQRWRYKDSMGRAGIGFYFDQLGSDLGQTINRLEKGQLTNCANLCFTNPAKKHLTNHIEEKRKKLDRKEQVLKAIFGPTVEQEAESYLDDVITEHELRHVIDKIIPKTHAYSEAQAYLYASGGLKGLNIDLKQKEEYLEKSKDHREQRLEKLKRLDAPPILIQKEQESYDKKLKEIENYKQNLDFLKELIPKVPKEDYKMLSYVFSTLPDLESDSSLGHLNLLNNYYDEK